MNRQYDRAEVLEHVKSRLDFYARESYSHRDIGDDIQHHFVLEAPPSARTVKALFAELGEAP